MFAGGRSIILQPISGFPFSSLSFVLGEAGSPTCTCKNDFLSGSSDFGGVPCPSLEAPVPISMLLKSGKLKCERMYILITTRFLWVFVLFCAGQEIQRIRQNRLFCLVLLFSRTNENAVSSRHFSSLLSTDHRSLPLHLSHPSNSLTPTAIPNSSFLLQVTLYCMRATMLPFYISRCISQLLALVSCISMPVPLWTKVV